eukprot:Pgem_evm1s1795
MSDKVEIAPGKFLRLCIIIKKQNRKKPNSHEWFFRAFDPHHHGEYCLTTDCGTLYARHCLYNLLAYLYHHRDVAAVTGRQRVMSTKMQTQKAEGLQAAWYRAAQAYDYEATISAFQGAFSLCGMLPVIPGPCGLFRMISHDSGILAGNLMLAEDRILSYAAALKTGKFTRWVPSAVFYSEAETKTKNFIAQRRRWNNGTFAVSTLLLGLYQTR